MVCKNLKLRPENKMARFVVGSVDSCEYLGKIEGIYLTLFNEGGCPFNKVCKYYKK